MTVSISIQYAFVRSATISSRLAAFVSARIPAEACRVVGMPGGLPGRARILPCAPDGKSALGGLQPGGQVPFEAQPAASAEPAGREVLELLDRCRVGPLH